MFSVEALWDSYSIGFEGSFFQVFWCLHGALRVQRIRVAKGGFGVKVGLSGLWGFRYSRG